MSQLAAGYRFQNGTGVGGKLTWALSEQSLEHPANGLQLPQLLFDLLQLLLNHSGYIRAFGPGSPLQVQQLLDFPKRKAEFFGATNKAHPPHRFGWVIPIAGQPSRWFRQ